MPVPPEFRSHLYSALHSKSGAGLVIETDDVDACRAKLYAARREAKDPELDQLSFCVSPANPTTEVWIVVRREAPIAQEN